MTDEQTALIEKAFANGWIGVDFDATLATYDGTFHSPVATGEPIPKMVARVKRWLARGHDVRIVTARAAATNLEETRAATEALQAWCRKEFGKPLPITSGKDPGMAVLWDDRVMPVIPNEGVVASHIHEFATTQVDIPSPLREAVRNWSEDMLSPEDLAEDGIEYQPHITVRYGIETDDPTPIIQALETAAPLHAQLGNLIVFPGEGGPDVLVAEVTSPELESLNAFICRTVPCTDTHPTYRPHMTLAYFQPGRAAEYAGIWPFAGETIVFQTLAFHDHYGRVRQIPLQEPTEKAEGEEVEIEKLSSEYLHAVLHKARAHLPGWLFKQLHALALPAAGGSALWRKRRLMAEEADGALVEQAATFSPDYLEKVLQKAKGHLPEWMWKQIHKLAMPSAGGHARWRKALEVSKAASFLESVRSQPQADWNGASVYLVKSELLAEYESISKEQPTVEDVHAVVPLGGESQPNGKATRLCPNCGAAAHRLPNGSYYCDACDQRVIKSIGPMDAPVAFVGASPSSIDFVRSEPFVGPAGATLREMYLKPLGLERQHVFLTNAVPVLLKAADGRVREPNAAEVEEWSSWLFRELAAAKPRIVVALGQTARRALGEYTDFMLPHPIAVRHYGHSGELTRKLRQVSKTLTEGVSKSSRWDEVSTVFEEPSIQWWCSDGKPDSGCCVAITKADAKRQVVVGVVLEPDTVDTQKDTISAEEIEATAHQYLVESRIVGAQHRKKARAEVVESYLAPCDFELGGQKVIKGSWVLGVHVLDSALWQDVEAGHYTGFSVGGVARRDPVR